MMGKTILIVEDDPGIRVIVQDALSEQGYDVKSAADGELGLEMALEIKPDLLILDVMLPLMDGFEICKRVRKEGMTSPIMMLTVKDEEVDKALLRRVEDYQNEISIYRFGNIELDFQKYESRRDGSDMGLTPLELKILKLMIERKGQVISRDEFLDFVWGADNLSVSHRTVDSHMAHIRKKIEDNPSKPLHIKSVHTIGYKFTD